MAQNTYFDPATQTENNQPAFNPEVLHDSFEPAGNSPTYQDQNQNYPENYSSFNQEFNPQNQFQDYNINANQVAQDQFYTDSTNYNGSYDQTYNVEQNPTKKQNFIVPITLGVLSLLFFALWGLERSNVISSALGLNKTQTNKVVTNEQDPSGYQACAAGGGTINNTLPRSCLLNDIYYFENIPDGNIEEYKKSLELEGTLKGNGVFKPKNYANFDKIIDSSATIPGAPAYTLKESNQLTYKMEIYTKLEADSKPEIKTPANSAAKIEGVGNLKGYETADAYIVSPKNAVLGEVYIQVHATARDNNVILSTPLKNDPKIKAVGEKCLNKKYEVDANYKENLQKCFSEEIAKDAGAMEGARNMVNKLLDIFQL